MKKRFRNVLISALVLGMLIPGMSVFARQIGTLSAFELPRWQTVVSTNYLTKSITNAPWVVNLTKLDNCSSVDTYLANSNGERRSDYTVVGLGRHEIRSWGQANYIYKAVFMNHDSQWTSGYITGSWSPDNR